MYVSSKDSNLSSNNILDLVNKSAVNNKLVDVSGLLMGFKRHFVQYLEGPSIEVYQLFKKIKIDSRHYDVALIYYKPLVNRIFNDWGMSYHEVELIKEGSGSVLDKLDELILSGKKMNDEEITKLLDHLNS